MDTQNIICQAEEILRGRGREGLAEAARLLRQGGVVAFPTETVYGLGANALDPEAVKKIFAAKGRPSDNPLIVHGPIWPDLRPLARTVPDKAEILAEAFWPGPLTLVLPASPELPREVTAGLDTVGLRVPDHPVALAFLEECGVPVAAPSANRSGRPSPTSASHVAEDLQGLIEAIVDGGETGIGVESTVLDLTVEPPMILRPGAVTREELAEVIGEVAVDPALEAEGVPRSPGMKYTHYAPQAPLLLLEGDEAAQAQAIRRIIDQAPISGAVILLLSQETAEGLPAMPEGFAVISLGSRKSLAEVAQNLYKALRLCDEGQAKVIFAETFPSRGLGLAVMNRLHKAAGGKWWDG